MYYLILRLWITFYINLYKIYGFIPYLCFIINIDKKRFWRMKKIILDIIFIIVINIFFFISCDKIFNLLLFK
jgi:hypothetical protein